MPGHYHRAASRADLTPNALFRPYQRRKCCRFCDGVRRSIRGSVQRYHRIFVAAVAHAAPSAKMPWRDPFEGLIVGFLRLGFEHEPLARAPAPRTHHRVEALWELVLVVMRVEVGAQVEIALPTPQGTEVFAQINGAGAP
jgi:hypothetical protein